MTFYPKYEFFSKLWLFLKNLKNDFKIWNSKMVQSQQQKENSKTTERQNCGLVPHLPGPVWPDTPLPATPRGAGLPPGQWRWTSAMTSRRGAAAPVRRPRSDGRPEPGGPVWADITNQSINNICKKKISAGQMCENESIKAADLGCFETHFLMLLFLYLFILFTFWIVYF